VEGVDRGLAAFDFDGTLSRRDTLLPFLAAVDGTSAFAAAWTHLAGQAARGRLDVRDRDEVKARLVRRLLAGRSLDELVSKGERYARDLMSDDRLRPLVVDRLHAHRDRGDTCVLVSASLVYYLEPIARAFGLDGVVGVRPAEEAGVLTGELTRPNVRAEQKVVQLQEWLDARGLTPRPGERSAYGNTSGDHALLAHADHRYWLGRSAKLPPGCEVLLASTPLR
jgi:phosphatidylglycerophosphatase C